MSSDDDIPEYLKGVAPTKAGFEDRDNVTIRPDREGDLGRGPARSPKVDDDDDDDEDERHARPLLPFPPQLLIVAVLVVMAFGMLGCAGIAAYGTWVGDAERAALAASGELSRTVDEERKIIDELGSRGGNRAQLMASFTAMEGADGHQRGRAALEFARLVDKEIVAIGDVRGTVLDDRQKKIRLSQDRYEAAVGSWRAAASNPLGRIACGVGIANAPVP